MLDIWDEGVDYLGFLDRDVVFEDLSYARNPAL